MNLLENLNSNILYLEESLLTPNHFRKEAIGLPTELTTERKNWCLFEVETKKGTVLVYKISGVIVGKSYWWPDATINLIQEFKAAENNNNIIGHLFYIDSPGGDPLLLDRLSEQIELSNKPTATFTDNLLASAGYHIAAGTKRIFAYSRNNIIGSIGGMGSMMNFKKYYERLGIEEIKINSDYSPLKNKIFEDAKKGETDDYKKMLLNPPTKEFIELVQKHRPKLAGEMDVPALQGQIFYAHEAVEIGLIDELADLDTAINWVANQAENNQAFNNLF
jgi:protease-4